MDRGRDGEDVATLDERERASERFFDRWANSYEERRISPWFQFTQHLAIDHLGLHPDSALLDVGCGTGYAVRVAAAMMPEGRASGIDISAVMLERARTKLEPDIRERVEFCQANAANIPYPDATFSHLLCTNSFHHYPDPGRALQEMKRVLVPGGKLVVFENAPELSRYTWMWDRILRLVEKGHVRYYPTNELEGLIARAGFENLTLHHRRNYFMHHGKLFASVQLWGAWRPLAP